MSGSQQQLLVSCTCDWMMVWLPLNGDLRSLSLRWRLLRLLRWSCWRNLAIWKKNQILKKNKVDVGFRSSSSDLQAAQDDRVKKDVDLLELVGAPAGG